MPAWWLRHLVCDFSFFMYFEHQQRPNLKLGQGLDSLNHSSSSLSNIFDTPWCWLSLTQNQAFSTQPDKACIPGTPSPPPYTLAVCGRSHMFPRPVEAPKAMRMKSFLSIQCCVSIFSSTVFKSKCLVDRTSVGLDTKERPTVFVSTSIVSRRS